MWQVIGITAIILISKTSEASENIPSNNQERQKTVNRLESTDTELPFIPPASTIGKILKNHVKRRSIIKLDIHDGLTMHKLSSGGPMLSKWSYWPDIERDKERRNPSFSPWGGKRDSSGYKPDSKIRRPARVPFNSWGGKRDGGGSLIKKPFNSWGGKRSMLIEDILTSATRINEPLRKSWHHWSMNNPKLIAIDFKNLETSTLNGIEKQQQFVNQKAPLASLNNHLPRVSFQLWNGKNCANVEASDESDVSSASSSPTDSDSE